MLICFIIYQFSDGFSLNLDIVASMFSLSCSLDISIVISEFFAGILIFLLICCIIYQFSDGVNLNIAASMFSFSCSLDISIVVSEFLAGILNFCSLVASFISSLTVLVLILTYWSHQCSVPRGLDLSLLVAHCSVIVIALISNILDTSLSRLPDSLDLNTSTHSSVSPEPQS